MRGGLIVEHWSWRWIFFVNLPITAAASALIVFGLKETMAERRKPKLDLLGTATLLCGLILLFYALSLSANAHQPSNAKLWGLMALALVVLTGFFFNFLFGFGRAIPMGINKAAF